METSELLMLYGIAVPDDDIVKDFTSSIHFSFILEHYIVLKNYNARRLYVK